jgi:ferredoxin-NADP reductase
MHVFSRVVRLPSAIPFGLNELALKLHHHVTTVVRSMHRETERITAYELADPDDWDLPPFTPGAHLDVRLANQLVRTYSLCGDPSERNRYHIAVQREEQGRGGSRELHRQLKIGAILPVSLPRNHFPLATGASRHVMIAGGIGITPFLPMMSELRRRGERYILHYGAKTPDAMAFRDRLAHGASDDPIHLYYSRSADGRRLSLAQILQSIEVGEHVYCCGPSGLVAEVLERTSGRDPDTVHIERFGPGPRIAAEQGLTVELQRGARRVEVPPGETILEALRNAGVAIDSSCEAGVCMSCKVRYLAGTPIHRDLVLSAEERRQFMLPCVSGCSSQHLVLDL